MKRNQLVRTKNCWNVPGLCIERDNLGQRPLLSLNTVDIYTHGVQTAGHILGAFNLYVYSYIPYFRNMLTSSQNRGVTVE